MTPPTGPRQVRALFDIVVDLPPDQRGRYLDEHCHDPAVRQRVERLLAALAAARERSWGGFVEAGGATARYTPPGDGSLHSTSETRPRGAGRRGRGRVAPPTNVPGYEVLELLGRGGMGVVYKARAARLGRYVALKFLSPRLAKKPGWLERFQREARTASALNHPHICTVHDLGEHDGRPFIVMELVQGRTFRDLVAEPWPVAPLAGLFAQVARALAAAHAEGVIHRDVKPANIMVRDDRYAKLLDFGLARRVRRSPDADPAASEGTRPSRRAGTPLYMSPEQVRGDKLTGATDIYSLGVTITECVTGRHPFAPESAARVGPAGTMSPALPVALDALLQKMMNPDARLRPTAVEAAEVLEQLRTAARPAAGPVQRHSVGREPNRASLRAAFDAATAGHGLVVCVTGEAGIGKTTLVEDFLAGLGDGRECAIARGRCSERLAGTEAYLPLLEALESLIRGPGGDTAVRRMKSAAPTWYAQLAPADHPSASRSAAETRPSSQERLKRELVAVLLELGGLRPVVLFFDDLHWADTATVDLLAYLGDKCAAMRLLVVLTYRPTEMRLSDHPFLKIQLELQGHSVCREVALEFLTRPDVARYLDLECPGHRFPAAFVDLVHARTAGNPLFMADLVRYLRDRGALVAGGGGWDLTRPLEELEGDLPESVRSMVRRKLDRLTESDRRLLTAASVQGQEFDAAVVARVLGLDAADVEERLAALERVHVLVRWLRDHELPDRTLTVRYAFVHVLYQNALYPDRQPTRKAAWSAATAQALLHFHGPRRGDVAAQLAFLFEAARDAARAVEFYRVAAETAAGLFAYGEAATLAERGLRQFRMLPEQTADALDELRFQIVLGGALQATRGYAAEVTGRAYGRARELCQHLPPGPLLFSAMWGVWLFDASRLDLVTARGLAEELVARAADSDQRRKAHWALGVTMLHQGDCVLATEQFRAVLSVVDSSSQPPPAGWHGPEPESASLAYLAYALWPLGYPDQALEMGRRAVARARRLAHHQSLCMALHFTAITHQRRGESRAAADVAGELIAVAADQGFATWLAFGRVTHGWARSVIGDRLDGLAELCQGLEGLQAAAIGFGRMRAWILLAATLAECGEAADAQTVLDGTLASLERTGERFLESDLYRVQGELLARPDAGSDALANAEPWFRRSIDVARRQQARSLELKAVVRLSRLLRTQGRQAEARAMLADIHGWFTEAFDTADLGEAQLLLKQLE